MDENNTNVDTGAADAATEQSTEIIDNTIIMCQADYDKAIQSAEDKVRGKLHNEIKELKTKLAEFEKPEKPDIEKELEQRVAEIESREKFIALKASLQEKSLDLNFADFLNESVDVELFNSLIEKSVLDKVKSRGYIPNDHQNNVGTTLEDWKKMSYAERAKFAESNPNLALEFARK